MGSSRASTTAGRRRTQPRTASSRTKHAARPARKKAGTGSATRKPPAKRPAARRKPPARRTRKASPKPKTRPARRTPRELARSLARPATAAWLVGILALLAGAYQFWLRDSSLVAVERIAVEGLAGPGSGEIQAALTEAAGSMTTLNVREEELEAAVAGFPTVVSVDADADFPHGLTITVRDRPPAMLAKRGDQLVPVAGDGTVLPGVETGDAKLPVVPVDDLPSRGRLSGGNLELALVAGAAPAPLRELITAVEHDADGVRVTLEGDIPAIFGTADRAADKWAAVAAVLAEPQIQTLSYLDVRVPERPAAGDAAPPTAAETTETGDSPVPATP